MGSLEVCPGKTFLSFFPIAYLLPKPKPTKPKLFFINDETIDDLLTFLGLFGRKEDNM